MKKTDVMRLRISPEKKTAYETVAAHAGLTLSQWVEQHLDIVIGSGLHVATKPKAKKSVATKAPVKPTNGKRPFVCLLKNQ